MNKAAYLSTFLFTVCLSFGSSSADLVMVGPNMQLVSTNAINSDSNPAYDVDTAFDGILNSAEVNGAVFNLPSQDPSVWIVDFNNVEDIDQLHLYQLVGGISDNGIRDFEVIFYAGDNATGAVLLSQSFSASLNSGSTVESFNLSSRVTNPESFTFSVSSAFGDATRAEFSEVQFNGNIVAVPEPASAALLAFALAGSYLTRRKRRC